MRFIVAICLFCSVLTHRANAQEVYNHWSVDANFGVSNALGPFSEGYLSNYMTFCSARAAGRYMFTNKLGIAMDFAFDRIKNDEVGYNGFLPGGKSLPFETHYFRTNLQLYFDVGRIIEIEQLQENLSLMFHLGWGFATLKDKHRSVWFKSWKTQGSDEMMSYLWGFTPQYRITDRWSINMDLCFVSNAFQSKTFDFKEENFSKGLNGKIIEFSVGASYYLGKHQKHLDWVTLPYGASTYFGADTVIKVKTIRTTETIKIRGNYPTDQSTQKKDSLDDARKPEGDLDGDGIPNSLDNCPTEYGEAPTGCPNSDRDGDGVKNQVDKCPDVFGVANNHGCPDIDLKTKVILNDAMIHVDFVVNSDQLLDESYTYLDKVVEALNEHPEYSLMVHGHTDNLGEEGPLVSISKARAKKVMEYLISKGIDASRLTYDGHGSSDPITSNESPSGRAQNERVEFEVIFN